MVIFYVTSTECRKLYTNICHKGNSFSSEFLVGAKLVPDNHTLNWVQYFNYLSYSLAIERGISSISCLNLDKFVGKPDEYIEI